jgi:orotate phosphoribosyltransferase
MSYFQEFLERVELLRKRVALFRNVSLHVHSPGSFDWRGGREESLFITGLKKSGLQLVAVAAHVDRDNGLRRAFRQTGRDMLDLYDPDAQVIDEEERRITKTKTPELWL